MSNGPQEFDSYADRYDEVLNEGLSATGETRDYYAEGRVLWLKKLLGDGPRKVLDFGCGTGGATPHFQAILQPTLIHGVDTSTASLDTARERFGAPDVTFAELSGRCDRPGEFDLAFCNGVFHHIPLADRAGAIRWVVDSLKPGGLFALWENNPWNPAVRWIMSRVPFDQDAILVWPAQARKLCRTGGLEILRTDHCFFFPRSLAALRPIEPHLSRVPLGGQYLVLARKPR